MKAIKCSIASESFEINGVTVAITPPLSMEEFVDDINLLRERPEELDEQRLKDIGGRLFQRVFTEAALKQYRRTAPAALALFVDDKLASLPWELLHDGVDWTTRTRGVVRVTSTEQRSPEILPKSGALRVLAVIAGPFSHPVDVDAHADMFRKLEEAQFPAEVKLRKHVTREMLSWEVSENYHVIHFVGHGDAGSLVFENRHGIADVAEENWLREQITVALRGSLRLVVINSCFSADADDQIPDIAATILETGVPALIAMRGSVSESANIAFMKNVYVGLGMGKPMDEAVMDARRAIAVDWQIKPWEWATPVLFVNESLLEAGASLNLMDADMAKMISEPKVTIIEPAKASPDPMMSRDDKFVGRREELSDILCSLDPEEQNGAQVVCLHGDSGMGKTAIAVEAANRMLEWFDDVIWLAGNDVLLAHIASEEGFLTTLAGKCGANLNGSENQAELRDRSLKSLSDGKRRLLALDGLESFVGSDIVRSLISNLPANCKALVTSQECLEIGERQIQVGPMNSHDSKQLILAYSALKGLEIGAEEASRIIHLAGGNPTTMRLVVSQVTSGEKTLDDALADLEKAEGIVSDYVFIRSLSLAGAEGRKLFAAMSIFFPTASGKALQSACGLSDLNFERAVENVVGLSLVESYGQGRRFGLHQLARAKAQQQLESDSDGDSYRERAAQFFVELVNVTAPMTRPEVAAKALGVQTLEGGAVQRIQDAAVEIFVKPAVKVLETELVNCFLTLEWLLEKDNVNTASSLFADLSGFLTTRGYWNESVYYLTRIVDGLKKRGESYTEAAVLLGVLYERRGRWEESTSHYEDALESALEAEDRELVANILNGLGTVYARQGDWDQASEYLEAAHRAFKQLGDENVEAMVLNNLGNIYYLNSQWDEAAGCFESACGIFQRQNNKPGEADAMANLAGCYQDSENVEKAAEQYDRALKIYTDLDNRDGQGNVLNSLGMLYQRSGDIERAIQFYDRALGIRHDMGDRVGQQRVLDNIAVVHSSQKEWARAASACVESFQLALAVHPNNVIVSLQNILDVSKNMLGGREFTLPAQLAEQLTQLIQNANPADDEMRTALAICRGVLTIIGFMAACECDKKSDVYKEALELARSLDKSTGAALNLVEWLKGDEEDDDK